MAVSSELVKKLRDKTGAGMMDCKKALDESNGDLEKAIEILRKKGAATAAKRADKTANEGIVVSKISDDAKYGILVEINCETDFVARGEDFVRFANSIGQIVFDKSPKSVEELLTLPHPNGKTVADALSDIVGKVGEKIEIRRIYSVKADGAFLESYIHMGSKLGVLVEFAAEFTPANKIMARDIAMQVAAMNPIVVSRDKVSKELLDKEVEIYRQQAKNEGKPEQIAEKIATGRLEKYFQEVVLLEQSFIKDAGKAVKDLLAPNVSVKQFKRFQLGESTN
ncbi:MAG: translation elongation factor Ts [Bacteroidota bacterium]|nr:translation elongation factor Ts [Bacteroidota bacterium]